MIDNRYSRTWNIVFLLGNAAILIAAAIAMAMLVGCAPIPWKNMEGDWFISKPWPDKDGYPQSWQVTHRNPNDPKL